MRKKNFLVNQDFIHTRIDRWFKKNICHVPQSLIEKSLRKGNIKINNVKIKSSYNLKKDDVITIKNITQKPVLFIRIVWTSKIFELPLL